jgi:hypothetical protein
MWETLYNWLMWGQIGYMIGGLILLVYFIRRIWTVESRDSKSKLSNQKLPTRS